MDKALLAAFFAAHTGRTPTGEDGSVLPARPTKKAALLGKRKICPVCRKVFAPSKEDRIFCSRACGEAFKLGISRDDYLDLQAETAGGVKNLRKCHDCGRPTTNYRCPECWRKLRGFSVADEGYEAW